jgi:hypothetical protein
MNWTGNLQPLVVEVGCYVGAKLADLDVAP